MPVGQQPPPVSAAPDNWGTAEAAATPPVPNLIRERLIVEIQNGLLRITGEHPASIVAIHNRQSLSNDIQKTTLYIITALFVMAGTFVMVFGPQQKYNTVILGVFLLVVAAGTFGFTTLSFRGFGFTGTVGQPQPNPTTTGRRATLLLLGVVIGGVAAYLLAAFKLIPVPAL